MDESDFLRRIHEDPRDELARTEYHRWLKEQGSPRATYMDLMARRIEVERRLAPIDEQLAQLIEEVGPHWITGLYPRPGKNPHRGGYTLNDGREVRVESLNQYSTYAGLIAGLPTRERNEKTLKRLVDEERARGPWIGEPYLVPPKIEPIEYWSGEREYPFGTPERLPSVTCRARLVSSTPARDSSKDISELSLIWFQDDFAFPIADRIVEHLIDLNWASLAIDDNL